MPNCASVSVRIVTPCIVMPLCLLCVALPCTRHFGFHVPHTGADVTYWLLTSTTGSAHSPPLCPAPCRRPCEATPGADVSRGRSPRSAGLCADVLESAREQPRHASKSPRGFSPEPPFWGHRVSSHAVSQPCTPPLPTRGGPVHVLASVPIHLKRGRRVTVAVSSSRLDSVGVGCIEIDCACRNDR